LILALLVAGAAVLSGCNGQILLDIDVAEDGSGTIRVEVEADAEAADQLLDLSGDSSLPLSDLAEADWDVSPPARRTEGCRVTTDSCLVVSAEKAFGSPSQFAEIMQEISGPDGMFQDFELVRSQSFGRVDYALTGFVDNERGFDSFGDEQMAVALGLSVTAIVTSPPYEARPEDVTVAIEMGLPGEIQEDSSNGDDLDDDPDRTTAQWVSDLSTPRLDVALFTARRSSTAQVLRGGAVVAAVVAVLLVFGQALLALGPLRRDRSAESAKPRMADALGRTAEEVRAEEAAAQAAAEAKEAPEEGYSVVALDGPGVLYREGSDVEQLLIPFLREQGSRIPDRDVAEKARLLSLGRITTPDFWLMMGLPGDPEELDAAYVARHQLNSGVVRYLRALRSNNIRVACVTNDAAAWARRLRVAHSLDGLIDTWVVSGSVGVRKPDNALYEVLRRTTGVGASSILLIDDDLDNLDAAKAIGMGTRWFTVDGEETVSRGHAIYRNFESATGQLQAAEAEADEEGMPVRLTDTGSVPVVAPAAATASEPASEPEPEPDPESAPEPAAEPAAEPEAEPEAEAEAEPGAAADPDPEPAAPSPPEAPPEPDSGQSEPEAREPEPEAEAGASESAAERD
jgi:putative hydrolase of the HAD superfamily